MCLIRTGQIVRVRVRIDTIASGMCTAIASIYAVSIARAFVLTLVELVATNKFAFCIPKTIKFARQHDLVASFEARQANCPIGARVADLVGSNQNNR